MSLYLADSIISSMASPAVPLQSLTSPPRTDYPFVKYSEISLCLDSGRADALAPVTGVRSQTLESGMKHSTMSFCLADSTRSCNDAQA